MIVIGEVSARERDLCLLMAQLRGYERALHLEDSLLNLEEKKN